MKTPEQLAKEYVDRDEIACASINHDAEDLVEAAFLAGYKAATDQLADTSKVTPDACEHILDMEKMVDVSSSVTFNNWISVKDRLPELVPHCTERSYGNDVLWLNKRGEMVVGNCRKVNEHISVLIPIGEPLITNFTHWMPLPKPPEDK